MAKFGVKKVGQWKEYREALNRVGTNAKPLFSAEFDEQGDFVRATLVGHIDAQDLGWIPNDAHTVELKGHDHILIESGALRNGVEVKYVSVADYGVFIGFTEKGNHNGLNDVQLMTMIEKGTSRMPARPLVQPTIDEVESLLVSEWADTFKQLIGF